MQVTIEKLVYGGAGLARTDQGVVFVQRTAPADVAEIVITGRKKDYAIGSVSRLIVPSPDRQEPFCPNYVTAGCCHWQHIRYDKQLEYKETILRESLTRIAHMEFNEPIRRISGPERAYRLRASFHVHHGRLGFVRDQSNTVVPINECAAFAPEVNAFIPAANSIIGQALFAKLEQAHVVAVADGTAATFTFPEEADQHPWERLRDLVFERIPSLDALTFEVGNQRLHYERQLTSIEVRGVRYAVNSDVFFQANRFLLEAFVEEVVQQAGPRTQRCLDLFSGSGFFSIPLAKVSGQLIGVESSRVAVKQARENAKLNGVGNVEFAAGLVDTTLAGADVHADLVVLNPPRAGAGAGVAAQIAELKAPRLVYVSCNPAA